jgi:hypothetical protein
MISTRAAAFRDRAIVLARRSVCHCQVDVCVEREGIQPAGALAFGKGLCNTATPDEGRDARCPSFWRVGVELPGAPELFVAFFPLPVEVVQDRPECPVRLSERLIELQRLARGRFRLRGRLARRQWTSEQKLVLCLRQGRNS